jgi:hypothetical protein
MPLLAPPLPPLRVAIADDDRNRFWFHHWLLVQSGLTILVTVWFISLGPIPGILALVVAKEILVALLAAGLGFGPATRLRRIYGAPATTTSPRPETSGSDQEGGGRLQPRG